MRRSRTMFTMWNPYASLALLIGLLFFLTSCGSGNAPVIETDIHTGTEGLMMAFTKDMPPEDISDKSSFQIGVEVRNKGTFDIINGRLTLINYYPEEMQMLDPSKTKSFDIEGKSVYNSEGGFDLVTWTIENKNLAIRLRDEQRFLFKILGCYRYRTVSSASVCVKPRSFGFSLAGTHCDTEDIKLGDGQGAPITVSKIEQNVIPKTDPQTGQVTYKGEYKILIQNKGGGYATDPNTYEDACASATPKSNVLLAKNVHVEMVNRELECTPLQQVKNTQDFFTICTLDFGQLQDSFETLLTTTIDYGYISEPIEKTVFVKKISKDYICPAENCKDLQYGVCDLYGRENVQASGSGGINQKCWFESKESCTRDFGSLGYACRSSGQCKAGTIITGYCPGSADNVCCEAG